MTHTEQRHIAGTFAECNSCHREPLHVVVAGRCSKDPIDVRRTWPSERHLIECCRCSRSTGLHNTLDEAIAEWGAAYSQGQLELPQRRARVA